MIPVPRATALMLSLLVLAQALGGPALALNLAECTTPDGTHYNCVTEEIVHTIIQPIYDNGLEGTAEVANNSGGASTSWPSFFQDRPMLGGVFIGGAFETLARLNAANSTVSTPDPLNQPVYWTDTQRQTYNAGMQAAYGNLQGAFLHRFRLDPVDIMSGSSEWFYRSPIKWEPANYSALYVNILDPGANVVAALSYDSEANPIGRTNDSMVRDDRVYFHATAPLYSNTTYTVVTYLRSTGPGTMETQFGHIDAYLATNQDIAADGFRSFTAFPSQSAAANVEEELGYSFRFTHGIGPGGINAFVDANATMPTVDLFLSPTQGTNGQGASTNTVTFIVPINTTTALSGSWTLSVRDGTGTTAWMGTFSNVTGYVIIRVATTGWTPTVATHVWDLRLRFLDFAAGAFVLPLIYDPAGPGMIVTQSNADGSIKNTHALDWRTNVQFTEENAPAPSSASLYDTATNRLGDRGVLVLGLMFLALALILAPVSIPLAIGAGALAYVTIQAGRAGTGLEGVRANIDKLIRGGASIAAVAACGGAFIAPGIGSKVALGAACALLGSVAFGGLPGLLRFLLDIPTIAINTVEKVAEVAYWLLDLVRGIFLELTPIVVFFFLVAQAFTLWWFFREALLIVCSFLRSFFAWAPRVRVAADRMWWYVVAIPAPIWDALVWRFFGTARGDHVQWSRRRLDGRGLPVGVEWGRDKADHMGGSRFWRLRG